MKQLSNPKKFIKPLTEAQKEAKNSDEEAI